MHKPISPERLDHYAGERVNYIKAETVAAATKAYGAMLPETVVSLLDAAVECLRVDIGDAIAKRDAIWAEE